MRATSISASTCVCVCVSGCGFFAFLFVSERVIRMRVIALSFFFFHSSSSLVLGFSGARRISVGSCSLLLGGRRDRYRQSTLHIMMEDDTDERRTKEAGGDEIGARVATLPNPPLTYYYWDVEEEETDEDIVGTASDARTNGLHAFLESAVIEEEDDDDDDEEEEEEEEAQAGQAQEEDADEEKREDQSLCGFLAALCMPKVTGERKRRRGSVLDELRGMWTNLEVRTCRESHCTCT